MSVLMGIGGEQGIDSIVDGIPRSQSLIRSWGYPDTGVVISHFNHEGFLLDYSACGPQGEPSLVYVYFESYPAIEIVQVSPDLETFFSQLEFDPYLEDTLSQIEFENDESFV